MTAEHSPPRQAGADPLSFGPRYRIRRAAEFERVYRRRQSASDERLLVFGSENGLGHPRLGLSVSRKLGGAVRRNRWKRLVREAFRLSRPELGGIDLVVIPRQGVEPRLEELIESLSKLAGRLARRLKR